MRRRLAFLVSSLVAALASLSLSVSVACQLVDPASTLDKDFGGDGGAIEDTSAARPGVRCYVDVVDEQPIYDYCPAGQACCYGNPLGTGGCQAASSCANLSFTCSDPAQCPANELCCAPSGLNGTYLVLGGSHCADACVGNELILCDLNQSHVCPGGTTCQTNGAGNQPLGYDNCR